METEAKKSRKRIIGIRTQLLITMLIISLFLTVGIICSMVLIVSGTYDLKINRDNENLTTLISGNLTLFVDKAYKVAETLVQDSKITSMDGQTQTQVLKNIIAKNDYFELLSIEDAKGMQISKSEGELGDRSDKWWFKQMIETKQPFISKSFYSITSEKPITSVFMPIYDNDRFVGMIGCDFSLSYLQKLVEEYSDTEDGRYSFIIDGEGVVIAHPDIQIVDQMYNYKTLTKTVKEVDSNQTILKDENGNIKTHEEQFQISDGYKTVISNVMNGNSGSIKINDNGEFYYSSYSPIKLPGQSDNWSVITVQKESNAKTIMNSIIKSTIISSIIILAFSVIITLIVAGRIAKPIIAISKLLTKASTGDFTLKSDIHSKNEIGILSSSFNEMSEKISSLLNKSKSLSENIKESSAILTDKTEISANAANQIQKAVTEIAIGATNQASDSERCVKLSHNTAEKFNQLSQKSEFMINESVESSKVVNSGYAASR